jgi:hypothetical protein
MCTFSLILLVYTATNTATRWIHIQNTHLVGMTNIFISKDFTVFMLEDPEISSGSLPEDDRIHMVWSDYVS